MGYGLGIDLGTTYTAACLLRDGSTTMVQLGSRIPEIPTIVACTDIGSDIAVGEPALRTLMASPSNGTREFKRRIGDPVPIIMGGTTYSSEKLMGHVLSFVLDTVTQTEGSEPSEIAVSHPAGWGPYKSLRMTEVFAHAGCPHATSITEPEAAARHYLATRDLEPGATVAVFDFGGGTFDAAVLAHRGERGFTILGQPMGLEHVGGVDLDEIILDHVLRQIGVSLSTLSQTPETARALARLRADCVEAKEALSADTATVISVALPDMHTEVRLTRSEFETMIRPTIAKAVRAIDTTVEAARLEPDALDAILLVGGTSRIPLVSQMVGAHFDLPTLVDTHPKHTIASGAALSSSRLPSVPLESPPRRPAPPPSDSVSSAGIVAPPPPPPPKPTPQQRRLPFALALSALALLATAGLIVLNGGNTQSVQSGGAQTEALASQPSDPTTAPSTNDATSTTTTTDTPDGSNTSDGPVVGGAVALPTETSQPVAGPEGLGAALDGAAALVTSISDYRAGGANFVEPGPTSAPTARWQVNRKGSQTGAVVAGGLVFYAEDRDAEDVPHLVQHVVGVDAATGNEKWATRVDSFVQRLYTTPKSVLVHTTSGLIALDPSSGLQIGDLATRPIPLGLGAVLHDGKILLGTRDPDAWGQDQYVDSLTLDGHVDWTFESIDGQDGRGLLIGETAGILLLENSVISIDLQTGSEIWRSLDLAFQDVKVVSGDRVLISLEYNNFAVIDIRTREQIWSGGAGGSSVRRDEDSYYAIAPGGGRLVRVSLDDGQSIWDVPTPSQIGLVVLSGDVVYIVDRIGQLAAHSAADGQLIWAIESGMESNVGVTASVGSNMIIVTNGTTISAFG